MKPMPNPIMTDDELRMDSAIEQLEMAIELLRANKGRIKAVAVFTLVGNQAETWCAGNVGDTIQLLYDQVPATITTLIHRAMGED
jgi:hypothetical protein